MASLLVVASVFPANMALSSVSIPLWDASATYTSKAANCGETLELGRFHSSIRSSLERERFPGELPRQGPGARGAQGQGDSLVSPSSSITL